MNFPIENGVEMRSMGPNLRLLDMHVLEPDNSGGKFAHVQSVFFCDKESGGSLVPQVTSVLFDPSLVPSGFGGRIERVTGDTLVNDQSAAGYHLEIHPDQPKRKVSEPFYLRHVEVHPTRDEFEKAHSLARSLFDKAYPETSSAWG